MPELSKGTKSHAAGGLSNLGRNRIHSHDDVPDQDQQGVAHQPDLRGEEGQPGEGDQDGEEGEGGDRIEDAGDREDRPAQESLAPGDQSEGNRDHQSNHDRDHRQLDVLHQRGADDLRVAGNPIPPDPRIVRCPEDPGGQHSPMLAADPPPRNLE